MSEGFPALFALSQPHNNLSCACVNKSHEADLLPSFRQVLLIDTNGVYPYRAGQSSISHATKTCVEIACYFEVPKAVVSVVPDENSVGIVRITPAIRKSFVHPKGPGDIDLVVEQLASNLIGAGSREKLEKPNAPVSGRKWVVCIPLHSVPKRRGCGFKFQPRAEDFECRRGYVRYILRSE